MVLDDDLLGSAFSAGGAADVRMKLYASDGVVGLSPLYPREAYASHFTSDVEQRMGYYVKWCNKHFNAQLLR